MRRKLKELCPECGGTPWSIRFCDNRLNMSQYVSCVYCPDCGKTSKLHTNEDDALKEFYAEATVTQESNNDD